MAKAKSIEEVAGADQAAEDNTVTSENIVVNPFQKDLTTAKKTYYVNEFGEVIEPGSKEAKETKQKFLLVREGAAISPAIAEKYGFKDGVISASKKKADSEDK